jgi:hypothetical protein
VNQSLQVFLRNKARCSEKKSRGQTHLRPVFFIKAIPVSEFRKIVVIDHVIAVEDPLAGKTKMPEILFMSLSTNQG